MTNGNKPASLEQKEITDAITALQKGKMKAVSSSEAKCSVHNDLVDAHNDLVDAAILHLRIGEQLLYDVGELTSTVQKSGESGDWLGGFAFGKRKAYGLVAVVIAIGATVCVIKWGPSLVSALIPADKPAIEKIHHDRAQNVPTETKTGNG